MRLLAATVAVTSIAGCYASHERDVCAATSLDDGDWIDVVPPAADEPALELTREAHALHAAFAPELGSMSMVWNGDGFGLVGPGESSARFVELDRDGELRGEIVALPESGEVALDHGDGHYGAMVTWDGHFSTYGFLDAGGERGAGWVEDRRSHGGSIAAIGDRGCWALATFDSHDTFTLRFTSSEGASLRPPYVVPDADARAPVRAFATLDGAILVWTRRGVSGGSFVGLQRFVAGHPDGDPVILPERRSLLDAALARDRLLVFSAAIDGSAVDVVDVNDLAAVHTERLGTDFDWESVTSMVGVDREGFVALCRREPAGGAEVRLFGVDGVPWGQPFVVPFPGVGRLGCGWNGSELVVAAIGGGSPTTSSLFVARVRPTFL